MARIGTQSWVTFHGRLSRKVYLFKHQIFIQSPPWREEAGGTGKSMDSESGVHLDDPGSDTLKGIGE